MTTEKSLCMYFKSCIDNIGNTTIYVVSQPRWMIIWWEMELM